MIFDQKPDVDVMDEIRTRKIIREELTRNYRPKNGLLKILAMVLVGALLGSAITYGLVNRTGLLEKEALAPKSVKEFNISLKEGEHTVENAVAKKAIPSIVGITTESVGYSNNPFMYGVPKYMESVGSGVIISRDGYILTNAHVVDNGNAKSIKVLFANDEELQAEILWADATLDLAVIKVEGTDFPAIALGDSEKVLVGDKAIAIGNPLGLDLQSTLTSGYISGMDRSITVEDGNVMDGLIQTDAAINAGNSGGALLNAKGELVGINTAKPQVADGIGFAIPINSAKPIIEKILETGSFEPVYLGITGYNVALVRQFGDPNVKLPTDKGVVVHDVVAGSPGAKAGIVSGDIITAIDGNVVDSMNGLKTALVRYSTGESATVTFWHEGEQKEEEVVFTSFSLK